MKKQRERRVAFDQRLPTAASGPRETRRIVNPEHLLSRRDANRGQLTERPASRAESANCWSRLDRDTREQAPAASPDLLRAVRRTHRPGTGRECCRWNNGDGWSARGSALASALREHVGKLPPGGDVELAEGSAQVSLD